MAQLCVTKWWSCVLGQYKTLLGGSRWWLMILGQWRAFMPLYIGQRGDLVRCYRCLTDSLTLKDRATQLLLKYKSGALVTQKRAMHPASQDKKHFNPSRRPSQAYVKLLRLVQKIHFCVDIRYQSGSSWETVHTCSFQIRIYMRASFPWGNIWNFDAVNEENRQMSRSCPTRHTNN